MNYDNSSRQYKQRGVRLFTNKRRRSPSVCSHSVSSGVCLRERHEHRRKHRPYCACVQLWQENEKTKSEPTGGTKRRSSKNGSIFIFFTTITTCKYYITSLQTAKSKRGVLDVSGSFWPYKAVGLFLLNYKVFIAKTYGSFSMAPLASVEFPLSAEPLKELCWAATLMDRQPWGTAATVGSLWPTPFPSSNRKKKDSGLCRREKFFLLDSCLQVKNTKLFTLSYRSCVELLLRKTQLLTWWSFEIKKRTVSSIYWNF